MLVVTFESTFTWISLQKVTEIVEKKHQGYFENDYSSDPATICVTDK